MEGDPLTGKVIGLGIEVHGHLGRDCWIYPMGSPWQPELFLVTIKHGRDSTRYLC
jgi:hypothetical protein